MERSPDEFRKDLERLYKLGFRPVTVSEYLEDRMDLPPGATPAVFTFDDSNPSQFAMREDGSIDPDSGIGIWKAFAEEHPDFPIKATFYVLPGMWGQPKWIEKKLEMLRAWGCELGSHTMTHRNLKTLSDDEVKKELGGAIDMLEGYGEKSPVSFALPLGISPKNRSLLRSFEWQGKTYSMKAAMLVGANPAPAPNDPKFDPYRIPRIQATKGISGLDYWLDQVEKGRVKLYVSP